VNGRTVVMSGATSGIGEVAALEFARRGARIVFIARDPARADALLARLQAINPRSLHAWHIADLAQLGQQRSVAAAIAAIEPAIDVLVNNAGAVFLGRTRTADGLAASCALNHLSYYTLTLGLLDRLRATPGARITCTSSRAHRYAKLDPARLQRDGLRGYANSKLANILFTRHLAQLLAGSGVTVNAFHPGFVATRFADNCAWPWRTLMSWRKRATGLTPEQGAETLVWLATAPELAGRSGGYYVGCQEAVPSEAAHDDRLATLLWAESARITGLDFAT
jgi:NAD(P)-dependent dehydrogenase (short-subunit alcohol dehydrogenase family)